MDRLHPESEVAAQSSGLVARRGVSICAPAKINLFLHVGAKRDDGYHALQSFAVFAQLCDKLSFRQADDLSLSISGPFAQALEKENDNLVLRAARALKDSGGKKTRAAGAAIALDKQLPVASGIGGGSADAAAALRALNLLWDCGHSEKKLQEIAAEIGSDVPACLYSQPLLIEGRGEQITFCDAVPGAALLLINPGVPVSTAKVFAKLDKKPDVLPEVTAPSGMRTIWDVEAFLHDTQNHLEGAACELAPEINEVLEALEDKPGCVLARMSGSGATCFALFEGKHFLLPAAENIAHEHPEWWVRATRIAGPDIGTPDWTA